MNCPKCTRELQTKTIHGIEIDECANCEGIWFDNNELKRVKDKIDADLNWMDFDVWKHQDRFKVAPKTQNCPKCDMAMGVIDYDDSKVEVDCCTSCKGVWLDKNELHQLIDYLEEEILTKSMGEYVKATIEEAKDLLTGPESFLSEWKDFSTVLRFLQYRILTNNPKVRNALVSLQSNPLNQ